MRKGPFKKSCLCRVWGINEHFNFYNNFLLHSVTNLVNEKEKIIICLLNLNLHINWVLRRFKTPSLYFHVYLCIQIQLDKVWRHTSILFERYNNIFTFLKVLKWCLKYIISIKYTFWTLIFLHECIVSTVSERIWSKGLKFSYKLFAPLRSVSRYFASDLSEQQAHSKMWKIGEVRAVRRSKTFEQHLKLKCNLCYLWYYPFPIMSSVKIT